jgi:murein DD-endopeptidase MepM/ murein hydrolase activator NlpD
MNYPGAHRAKLCALAGVAICVMGCATTDQKFGDQPWYQDTKQASAKAVEVTTTTATKAAEVTSTTASKAYARMQKYLAEKDLLKTFHDSSEHSEVAVLSVLLDAGIVSSEYGERWGKVHQGLDIAADVGEPVYAIADGEVIYAGDGLRGYGNVVILRHDRKTSSLYEHNSELKVKVGDQVKQGTVVSLLGSTGHSTGPHVHFEIRNGDVAVNPRDVLPKSKLADAVVPSRDRADAGAELAGAAAQMGHSPAM